MGHEIEAAADIEAATPITVGASNEEMAKKFRNALLASKDGKPEGSRDSLARCAAMLDTYTPDLFPANDKGQVDFARAIMESVADEIRAFLKRDASLITAHRRFHTKAGCPGLPECYVCAAEEWGALQCQSDIR